MLSKEEDIIFAVIVTAVVFLLLSGFIILLVYNYFKVRIQKEKEILNVIFQTQENERTRIAEELHDDIGGTLSALKLQNELLKTESAKSEVVTYAEKNASLIDRIVKDIRIIVRNQAAKFIIENGLMNELHQLKKQYLAANGIQINPDIDFNNINLKNDFEVSLFRIFQELIHNSIKHAECSEININGSVRGNRLEVFYSDNGKGFQQINNSPAGMGLKNIKARIELYQGTYIFKSIPNEETSYTICFQLPVLINSTNP